MNGEGSFNQQIFIEYLLDAQHCAKDLGVTRTASVQASIIIQPMEETDLSPDMQSWEGVPGGGLTDPA